MYKSLEKHINKLNIEFRDSYINILQTSLIDLATFGKSDINKYVFNHIFENVEQTAICELYDFLTNTFKIRTATLSGNHMCIEFITPLNLRDIE